MEADGRLTFGVRSRFAGFEPIGRSSIFGTTFFSFQNLVLFRGRSPRPSFRFHRNERQRNHGMPRLLVPQTEDSKSGTSVSALIFFVKFLLNFLRRFVVSAGSDNVANSGPLIPNGLRSLGGDADGRRLHSPARKETGGLLRRHVPERYGFGCSGLRRRIARAVRRQSSPRRRRRRTLPETRTAKLGEGHFERRRAFVPRRREKSRLRTRSLLVTGNLRRGVRGQSELCQVKIRRPKTGPDRFRLQAPPHCAGYSRSRTGMRRREPDRRRVGPCLGRSARERPRPSTSDRFPANASGRSDGGTARTAAGPKRIV